MFFFSFPFRFLYQYGSQLGGCPLCVARKYNRARSPHLMRTRHDDDWKLESCHDGCDPCGRCVAPLSSSPFCCRPSFRFSALVFFAEKQKRKEATMLQRCLPVCPISTPCCQLGALTHPRSSSVFRPVLVPACLVSRRGARVKAFSLSWVALSCN